MSAETEDIPSLDSRFKAVIRGLRGAAPAAKEFVEGDRFGRLALVAIDATLRGLSQVYLVDNPLAGLIMTVGLLLSTGHMQGVYAVCGSGVALLGALVVDPNGLLRNNNARSGLFGYDGALCGAAVATFYAESQVRSWEGAITALFLCFMCGVVRHNIGNAFQRLGVPPFTLCFNLMAMMLFQSVKRGTVDLDPSTAVSTSGDFKSAIFWWESIARGVGQLTLCDSPIGGLLILLALFWCSFDVGAVGLAGSFVGMLTALSMDGFSTGSRVSKAAHYGLYGYNSCGAAIVAWSMLKHSELRHRIIMTILAMPLATFFTDAIGQAISIPVLTAPFVLTSWIIWFHRLPPDDEFGL